jgi:hypothetical protein
MRDLAARSEALRAASERLRTASRELQQQSGFLCRRSTIQVGRSNDLGTASLFLQHRFTKTWETSRSPQPPRLRLIA